MATKRSGLIKNATGPSSWDRSYERLLKAVQYIPASGEGDAAALDAIYITLWYLMKQPDIPGVSEYPVGFEWAEELEIAPEPFQTRLERMSPKKKRVKAE